MLTPIVCPTCGISLGDLAGIYNKVLSDRMSVRYGPNSEVSPVYASLDADQNPMGDVLNALRLSACCRTHMITNIDYRTFYK
jgi:DNA-directed RNA polymerase subunit N (RpoN/RPB10)